MFGVERGGGQHDKSIATTEGGVVLEGNVPAEGFGALDVGGEVGDGAVVEAIEAELGDCHCESIGRQGVCHNAGIVQWTRRLSERGAKQSGAA